MISRNPWLMSLSFALALIWGGDSHVRGAVVEGPNAVARLRSDDLAGLDQSAVPGQAGSIFSSGPPGAMLVDRAHGQNFDIHTFTETLEAQGWVVEEVTNGPIDFQILESFDVFVVPVRTWDIGINSFSEDEVNAVKLFLNRGAGLWLFHEYRQDPSGINSLASSLGVEYKNCWVTDPVDNYDGGVGYWPIIRPVYGHPALDNVFLFRHMAGCSMVVSGQAQILASAGENALAEGCPLPPPVLAAWESSGRVVFSCDMTPLHRDYFPGRLTEDEIRLIENIVIWLRISPLIPNEGISWGDLKAQYLK